MWKAFLSIFCDHWDFFNWKINHVFIRKFIYEVLIQTSRLSLLLNAFSRYFWTTLSTRSIHFSFPGEEKSGSLWRPEKLKRMKFHYNSEHQTDLRAIEVANGFRFEGKRKLPFKPSEKCPPQKYMLEEITIHTQTHFTRFLT